MINTVDEDRLRAALTLTAEDFYHNAIQSAHFPKLDKPTKELLVNAAAELRMRVADLDKTIAMLSDPTIRQVFYEELDKLIRCASIIGSYATISDGAKTYLKSSQAQKARSGKKKIHSDRQKRLILAIKYVVGSSQMIDSDKFADSIHDLVHKRLGSRDSWPSTTTIRRTIKVILQE
jgi:hypothetical protein